MEPLATSHTSAQRREHDLSVISDIYAYLADTPFASYNVTALSGGIGNWTFRLYLRVPYEGHQTLVLKHGKSTVPNTDIPFSVVRQVSMNTPPQYIMDEICLLRNSKWRH
jgi:hypothetical protein